jgi:hypothetical protein
MKKLLLLLLLSLAFIGSAYAGDVYACKYRSQDISVNYGERTGLISPDITLIVEKKQVTTIWIGTDGKSYSDVYKIAKQDKKSLTALKKATSWRIEGVFFDKKNKEFSMTQLGFSSVTGSSGRCTFMYSQ